MCRSWSSWSLVTPAAFSRRRPEDPKRRLWRFGRDFDGRKPADVVSLLVLFICSDFETPCGHRPLHASKSELSQISKTYKFVGDSWFFWLLDLQNTSMPVNAKFQSGEAEKYSPLVDHYTASMRKNIKRIRKRCPKKMEGLFLMYREISPIEQFMLFFSMFFCCWLSPSTVSTSHR